MEQFSIKQQQMKQLELSSLSQYLPASKFKEWRTITFRFDLVKYLETFQPRQHHQVQRYVMMDILIIEEFV